MGAWGYEALDSDQALDWLGNNITDYVAGKIVKILDQKENGKYYEPMELRAAAETAIALAENRIFLSTPQEYEDIYEKLRDALSEMRDDKGWIESWTGPDEVRDSIDKQIERLSKIITDEKSTTLMDNLFPEPS